MFLLLWAAIFFFPNFEREEFNTEIVEEISSGIIKTTTTQETVEENLNQENKEDSSEEIFETKHL